MNAPLKGFAATIAQIFSAATNVLATVDTPCKLTARLAKVPIAIIIVSRSDS